MIRRSILLAATGAVLALAGLPTLVAPVAASCGIEPGEEFYTRTHQGAEPITAAWFGTVLDRSGTRGNAVYTVSVQDRVAGSLPPGPTIAYSGRLTCGSITLNVGQRYLFAVAPHQLDGDGSMVFETDGPAWRWLVGRGWIQPTLDGRRLPTDPDALLDVLRRRIEALPATSTLVPSVPTPSLGPLFVLLSGLGGGLAMLHRMKREP